MVKTCSHIYVNKVVKTASNNIYSVTKTTNNNTQTVIKTTKFLFISVKRNIVNKSDLRVALMYRVIHELWTLLQDIIPQHFVSKGSQKHVSDSEQVRSYDHLKLGTNIIDY